MLRILLCLLFVAIFNTTHAAAPTNIPPALQDWRDWVLHDQSDFICPYQHNRNSRRCEWSSGLTLELDSHGGKFVYDVEVFNRSWITLPGSSDYWPQNVRHNGQDLTVIEKNNRPQARLNKGVYRLEGRFIWNELPRSLEVPPQAGLIQLSIDRQTVLQPLYENASTLWLRSERSSRPENQQNEMDIKVFRKLTDHNPALIETLIHLDVSGEEREITTGPALLDGFTVQRFESDLPARIEHDGTLRIQLKPGRWQLRVLAHSQQPLDKLQFSPAGEHWPSQEVWVFESVPSLRTVQASGLPSIDPRQTTLPQEWYNLPAYLAEPGRVLVFEEQYRGNLSSRANQLRLNKTLWLAFSGEYFTVLDRISGTFNESRLQTTPQYQLGRAEQNGTPLVITQLPGSESTGIEIRDTHLNLDATSLLSKESTYSSSGWTQTFTDMQHTLVLPPGWSLFHASGADSVYGSWVGKWNLWHIFLLLLVVVALSRSFSWKMGALALVTLLLTYHRASAPLFIWLNFAALYALRPYVSGKFSAWFDRYTLASFAVCLLLLTPFIVQQVRLALYPQLELNQLASAPSSYEQTAATPNRSRNAPSNETFADDGIEEVVVTGIRSSKQQYLSTPEPESPRLDLYDANQKVQVGPGLPDWSWQQNRLHWSGPITTAETHRLWLISPLWNRLGYALSAIMQLLLLLSIAGCFYASQWPQWRNKLSRGGASVTGLLLVGLLIPPDTNAQHFPPENILTELEERLTRPPECLPSCASIESVLLQSNNNQLSVTLVAHSAEDMSFPLPGDVSNWIPQRVDLNGVRAKWLHKEDDRLFIRLRPGRHQINLSGTTQGLDQVVLDFGIALHNVQTELQNWQVSGVPQSRQTSRSLQLQRTLQGDELTAEKLLPDPVAPLVRIIRNVHLGLDWRVSTTVQRIAPANGAIHLSVPLLDGEAPTSGTLTREGEMRVSMDEHQGIFSWNATLKESPQIVLRTYPNPAWTETWKVEASTHWHVQTDGIAPLANSGAAGSWTWLPWNNETVTLDIVKPEAAAGRSLSIDALTLQQAVGKRTGEISLELQIRASQGSQYNFNLPENAQFKRLLIDGTETPVGRDDSQLQIPIAPGKHRIDVEWNDQQSVALRTATPALDMGLPVSNIRLQQQLPKDRWLLFVNGPTVGPAILFWGVLIVVIMAALALGKSGLTPLKTWHWIVLSLGTVAIDLYLLMIVAAWFIALEWRGRRQDAPDRQAFNLMQVALIGFSLVTLGALLASIPASLLSSPDMLLTGNGSSGTSLRWYQDASAGTIAQGYALSLPIWCYRLVMLLWAIWLAFALMRWIPWAWKQLCAGGFWFQQPKNKRERGVSSSKGKDSQEALPDRSGPDTK